MFAQKIVRELMVKEYETLSETIIDFSNCFDYEPKKIDMLINREDILKSFLSYLKFWVFKGGTKKNVQFVLKCMRKIIKSQEDDHMIAMQNVFDNLGATKNIILLISNEMNGDKKYLMGM